MNANKKTLYILSGISGNRIFGGFSLDGLPSNLGRETLEDDLTPAHGVPDTTREWEAPLLTATWSVPTISRKVNVNNDYPTTVWNTIPIFSKRAQLVLNHALEKDGEFLPVSTPQGQYFIYNVTSVVDALDIKNSICDFWCDPPTQALEVEYFYFDENKLTDAVIFRLIEDPGHVIVTEQFVRLVQKYGLNGFEFRKIWPLPQNVDWRKDVLAISFPEQECSLKDQSLTITFVLNGNDRNDVEELLTKQYIAEVDDLLLFSNPTLEYWGAFEGGDVYNGCYRMFFSCPSADKLLDKLVDWIESLTWAGKIMVVKRYGGMYDASAPTEFLELT